MLLILQMSKLRVKNNPILGLAPWCSGWVWCIPLQQTGLSVWILGGGTPLICHAVAVIHMQNRLGLAQMLAQG